MQGVQFYVVLDDGGWKIKFCDRLIGPYVSQEAAIHAAVETAHHSTAQWQHAEVFVQGVDKQFRTEWISGRDPFPPPAW